MRTQAIANVVFLWVVAGVATALCPDPLIELQLVRELNHGPPEQGGGAIVDPSVGLDSDSLCGLLLGCLAFGSRQLLHGLLL
jgi:hypothetical protein